MLQLQDTVSDVVVWVDGLSKQLPSNFRIKLGLVKIEVGFFMFLKTDFETIHLVL